MSGPRIGLVLGAGGLAGIAFHAGVLKGLADGLGWDPRTVDLVIGTSAGSITASGLRAGVSAEDIFARTCGTRLSREGAAILSAADAVMDRYRVVEPVRVPAGLPAAPGVVLAAGRRPWRVRPTAIVAGLLPAGRVETTPIAAGVDALFRGGWPSRQTWVCAVRLDSGRLTVFGRVRAPSATLGQAVAASCAIPGYFSPVVVGNVRYVDGGAHSLTNLSKVAREHLDLVVVSAPMSRAGPRRPGIGSLPREASRFQLGLEARRVRGAGTPVVAFAPTSEDQAVAGGNPMDPSRQAPIARQARDSTLRRLERADVRRRLHLLTARGDGS